MYESVTKTAERYGLPRRQVLEWCHARGQKFAFKPGGGKFLIHIERFKEFLERRMTR